MKKVLLASAVMLFSWAIADASWKTPVGPAQALQTADYGGYMYSTHTTGNLVSGAGVGYSTVAISGSESHVGGVFSGVQFSTGTTHDFVDVYDSTSADAGKIRGPMTRVYNVGASTGGIGSTAAGFSGPPRPMRFSQGLIIRPSRADFNSLNVLYNLEP